MDIGFTIHRTPKIKKINQKGSEKERFYVKHKINPILQNINSKISNLIKINDISTLTDKFIKDQIESIELTTDENMKQESSIEYLETEQIFEKRDNLRKKKNKEKKFRINFDRDPIKENNPNLINCLYPKQSKKLSDGNENKENLIKKQDKENFFNSPRTFDTKSIESLRKKQRSATVKEKNFNFNESNHNNSDHSLGKKKVFELDNFDFDQVCQEFVDCDYVLLKKEEFLKIVGNPKQSQFMLKSIEEFKDPKKNDMEKIKYENYKFMQVLDEKKSSEVSVEGLKKMEKNDFAKLLREEKEKQEACSIF